MLMPTRLPPCVLTIKFTVSPTAGALRLASRLMSSGSGCSASMHAVMPKTKRPAATRADLLMSGPPPILGDRLLHQENYAMRMVRQLFSATAALSLISATTSAQTKRAFALADWYRLATLSAPSMSPDGGRIAVQVQT